MNNTVRWTAAVVFIALNAVSNLVLGGTPAGIVLNVVSGIGLIALLADYLVRRRREH